MTYWRFWSWFWWGVAVLCLLRREFVEGLVCYGLCLQCKILSRSAQPQSGDGSRNPQTAVAPGEN